MAMTAPFVRQEAKNGPGLCRGGVSFGGGAGRRSACYIVDTIGAGRSMTDADSQPDDLRREAVAVVADFLHRAG